MVAVAVAAWVLVARLRRVARNYLKLRREMQQQRAFDLLGGGITRTRDRRLKFLLVTLPFVAILIAGVLVMIIFFPRQQPKVRRMICSVLAGYAWDRENPYTGPQAGRRLRALAEICRMG